MSDIYDWILNNRKIAAVLVVILLVAIGLVAVNMAKAHFDTVNSESALTKKLNRSDFSVTEILVDDGAWKFVQVTSNAKSDTGNTAFAILYDDGKQLILKLGPGTVFTRSSMEEVSIPEKIQKKILEAQDGK